MSVYIKGEAIPIASSYISKNFLTAENDGLAVSYVDADCSYTTKKIEVKGGPLADDTTDNWPWYEGDKRIIPANKSIQEIFTGLFFQILSGKIFKSDISWNPKIDPPSASISSTSVKEVGATVTVNFNTVPGVYNNTRSVTVYQDNQKFGIFVGDTWQQNDKKFEVTGSTTGTLGITESLWNNSTVSSGSTVTCKENTNTLYVKQGGLYATVNKFSGCPLCYGVKNSVPPEKNIDSIVDVNETNNPSNIALSNTNTKTVIAYYPIYVNGSNAQAYREDEVTPEPVEVAMVPDVGFKLPSLVADNTTFGVNFPAMIPGGEGWRIAIQKDKTITYAKARNTNTKKCDIDVKDKFVRSSSTVTKKSGGVDVEYYIWEHTGSKGYNLVMLKID